MLVLTKDQVREVLSFELLIPALAKAMEEFSAGTAIAPNRTGVSLEKPSRLLAAMPGFTSHSPLLGTKLVSLYPENGVVGLPTHQAVVVSFDLDTGSPEALLDGTLITEMRTAACSAVATDLLANPDARVHAVLGTGAQALSHARAISQVRDFDEIRICGRDRDKAVALAHRLSDSYGLPTSCVESWEEAMRNADVVSATTHSVEPVISHRSLSPGAHVNSVGFNPIGREVDDDTIGNAFVVVDAREAATSPPPAGTNDILEPIAKGLLDIKNLVELGDLVGGRVSGPGSRDGVTVYKSVGVAVQDCAAASVAIELARKQGFGLEISLG